MVAFPAVAFPAEATGGEVETAEEAARGAEEAEEAARGAEEAEEAEEARGAGCSLASRRRVSSPYERSRAYGEG